MVSFVMLMMTFGPHLLVGLVASVANCWWESWSFQLHHWLPGMGEGLETELVPNGQWVDQSCLCREAFMKILKIRDRRHSRLENSWRHRESSTPGKRARKYCTASIPLTLWISFIWLFLNYILFFVCYFLIFFYFLTLQYCIGFKIHWWPNEQMGFLSSANCSGKISETQGRSHGNTDLYSSKSEAQMTTCTCNWSSFRVAGNLVSPAYGI